MIQHTGRTSEQYVNYLETTWVPGKDITVITQGTPVDWAFESRDIGEAAIVQEGSSLGQDYCVKYALVVDSQLAFSGVASR